MGFEMLVALIAIAVVWYFLMSKGSSSTKKRSVNRNSTFNPILDNFKTVEEAQKALRQAGKSIDGLC